MKKRIFVVEDNPIDLAIICKMLDNLGYDTLTAEDGFTATQIIKHKHDEQIDLVLLDLNIPEIDGISVLGDIRANRPHIPVIILSSSEDVDDAVQTLKLGAADFLSKPPQIGRLEISIKNALKLNELDFQVKELRKAAVGEGFESIIGHDSGLAVVTQLGRKAANSEIGVLITGESGVGKELFSRAIHLESARGLKPFIAVNCGAIPKNLIESTLFGHEKGSFTGAISKAIGKFREAEGGTLFLDEVGELSLDAQVKLLRAIQEKKIEPVGFGKEVKVDARIIAATNRNLAEEVKKGNFREDLYYRLNMLQIELPPLRERVQDIPKLAEYFGHKAATSEHRPTPTISKKAMDILLKHQWPGNVRELENVITRAVIMSDGSSLEISEKDFKTSCINGSTNDTIKLQTESGQPKSMDEIESEIINIYLARYSNKVDKVSEILGLSKATIYRRLQK